MTLIIILYVLGIIAVGAALWFFVTLEAGLANAFGYGSGLSAGEVIAGIIAALLWPLTVLAFVLIGLSRMVKR